MSNIQGQSDAGYVSSVFADVILSAKGGVFCKDGQQLARSAADLMDSDLFGLYLLDDRLCPSGTLLSRPMDGFLWEYENFRSQDPIFLHMLRQQQATDGVSLLGLETWSRHPLAQFLGGWGLHYSLQGGVFVDGKVIATINFARSKRLGPFDRAQRLELDLICKQISGHISVQRESRVPRLSAELAINIRSINGKMAELIVLTDSLGSIIKSEMRRELSQIGIRPGDLKTAISENIKRLNTGLKDTIAESEIVVGQGAIFALTTFSVPGTGNFLSCMTFAEKEPGPQFDPLSHFGARTRTVLDLLVRGYSNKLIAREMMISENTVKDHIRRIYQHFGARTRTELAWVLHGKA